jgi:5-hydroxyisourate hydrolase
MGLSTHVLDTTHGKPAAGMAVTLARWVGNGWVQLKALTLDADGRTHGEPLITTEALQVGRYRLTFAVGAYFRALGVNLPTEAFLESVPIEFGISDVKQHYHVPLLCSPFGYGTYRGS